jgi:hypothetical protein
LIIDNGTVYLIQNAERFGFRDAAEYQSYGYNFDQVVPANAADLQLPFDAGNILKAMAGTLAVDASDGKTVYMVGSNYTKRGFTSVAVFQALGYSFDNLPRINSADYPVGPMIDSALAAHPDGSLVLDQGTIWWIGADQKQGFASMAVFNTYGFGSNRIVAANSADSALLTGELVKFRDGTLVLDSGIYYLISDGAALPFASADALTEWGYKTSNAINASLTEYTKGEQLQ